jgi:(p)ppGpp synthase/HD superfamily hydrolase
MNWNQELYIKALRFAAEAHQGQTIPGTALPYIVHPTQVVFELMPALDIEDYSQGNTAIVCAFLHDVLEDTSITAATIEDLFGDDVLKGVQALTKNKTLPKQVQMEDSLQRIRHSSRVIWMVKLCDRITNLAPPPAHWTKPKIREYREEAYLIYDMLGEASPYLAKRLLARIDKYGEYA